jgi:hypothetical protein
MNTENQFTLIVEQLLVGKFICIFTDETAFDYLSKEAYRQGIEEYLRKIGRCLKATDNKGAYYCAYTSVHANERRVDVRKQFRETINGMEPLCRWLKLVMSALQRDASLQPGDIIRNGELLSALEVTPALVDDLSIITRSGLFSTKREAAKDQLNHVFNALQDSGYLIRHSSTSSVYTATGKWSYLYDVLEFVHTHETIGGDESQKEQEELVL